MSKPTAPRSRIYLTRKNEDRRRVHNEDQVTGILKNFGFTTVDPGSMSIKEQVALFSRAEYVVSPHGGALSNIVFTPPETKIIEFFSPGYVNCCFWELSSMITI